MAIKPFTIAAFPRSGTKYTANLLYKNGIDCMHETLHPDQERSIPPLTHNVVTWVPFQWMQHWRYEQTTVLHLVRDPADVVRSWGKFQPINRGYLEDLTGEIDFEAVWYRYNAMIRVEAEYVFKVEELTDNWRLLMEFIGYDNQPLIHETSKDFHSYKRFPEYDTIKPTNNDFLQFARRQYGYA